MDNSKLSTVYSQNAAKSFKILCFKLLEQAYCSVLNKKMVDRNWDENAITELLVNCLNENPKTIQLYITASTEKRLLSNDTKCIPSKVDSLPRIDIIIGGFEQTEETKERVSYCMEAKNLYNHDFKKKGNSSNTSANAYAERYIRTGIDNILNEHYPCDSLLLGYVLVGNICEAMEKINKILIKSSRTNEVIAPFTEESCTRLVFGLSHHPKGKSIKHCFLLFS